MTRLLTLLLTVFFVQPAQAEKAPLIVELFTSQSCSSCPPADKLLGDLQQKHPHIIALSCHVTYWNHLHWRDTLSKPFCTDQQRWYATRVNSSVFTPQMVLNGQVSAVGSRQSKVLTALKKTEKNNTIIPLNFKQDGDQITIQNLPPKKDNHTVLLFTYKKTHTQNIPSGENAGRTVQYTNPVTTVTDLPDVSFTITSDLDTGHTVIYQNMKTGEILAAGRLSQPLN